MLCFWVFFSLVIVFSFSFAANLANTLQPFVFEEKIKEVLHKIGTSLKYIDPYLQEKLHFTIENDFIGAELKAKDVILQGFSKYELIDLKNKMTVIPMGFKTKLNIKFSEFRLTSRYYHINGLAVFFPIYGDGSFELVTKNVHIGIESQVTFTNSGSVKLQKLKFKFNSTQADFIISGLIHNEPFSRLVNVATTECFPEFIDMHNDRIGKLLGDALIAPINNILNPRLNKIKEDIPDTDKFASK